jgi:hypothetical protein
MIVAMKRAARIAVLLIACWYAPVASADFYVVVSERNPQESMTLQEVLHLYMGRTRTFADGRTAERFDVASSGVREGFYQALGGMNLSQVSSYWARLVFSGKSLPPQQLRDEQVVASKVRDDPRAIGWLTTEPQQKGLKVVLVLRAAQ